MEKEGVKNHHHHPNHNININGSASRHIIGPPQSDFVLRWGSRKRLRCMKIQVKNDSTRTTVRVDRRVVRSDYNTTPASGSHSTNGHFNLRQRPASPAHPLPRILRNSEGGSGMKGQHNNYQNNGGVRGLGIASPEREREKKSGVHENGGRTASSDTSGGGGDVVWPPKFVIALTNKEKEEDFMAIKGSKLPQRPKKRAKFIQRTLNLVSPGGWLCDLTLERYEVREKKITKKRPRGLKAMGNYMDSDSD